MEQNDCTPPGLLEHSIYAKNLERSMPKDQVLKRCSVSANDPVDLVQKFQEGTWERFECWIVVRDLEYLSLKSLLRYRNEHQ